MIFGLYSLVLLYLVKFLNRELLIGAEGEHIRCKSLYLFDYIFSFLGPSKVYESGSFVNIKGRDRINLR